MTEERADDDAGTPGPIDPRDVDALDLVYLTSLTESRMASSVLIGQVDQEALDFMDIATRELALLAVAGAVCPEHHAVFDTRTHVAVPVGAIREAAESLQKVANGSISGNNHSHRPWAQKRADAIRSLLPTESEATR